MGMENFTLARFGCFYFACRKHLRILLYVTFAVCRQISAVKEDGTFNIAYDDGVSETNRR